jgi:guanine nucleotide-binding protein subunit gamma
MEDKSEALSNRIAEIKLRRIQEFNSRLKEALLRERIPASNASLLYVFMSPFKKQK